MFYNFVFESLDDILKPKTPEELEHSVNNARNINLDKFLNAYDKGYIKNIPEKAINLLLKKSCQENNIELIGDLIKIHKELDDALGEKFDYHSFYLPISNTLIGMYFSALIAQIPSNTKIYFFIFYISPFLIAFLATAYFYNRKHIKKNDKKLAENIKNILIDPEKTN